ncbi:MAG: riboflavin synthase [Myxococcota bacterium]|nr:riboflavin synthase [Myxococcota bacterium]
MFTGIIEGLGRVISLRKTKQGADITVECPFTLDSASVGDSIAVNGVCLTATTLSGSQFSAVASHETLSRTSLGQLAVDSHVNIERALRLGDRLGGHMVQGHVDGVGALLDRQRTGEAIDMWFSCPTDLRDYLVEKGSIAIDGISLTLNSVDETRFRVTIIPHTADWTTLGEMAIGAVVNLETDVVGKYIVSLARRGRLTAASGLTMAKLEEHGFA